MLALILAAGLGTRLKPLTDHLPKALVPLAGKPLIEHQIIRLKEAGATHIIVNVHHHAQLIIDFLNNHHFGIDISISDESRQLLDTGGAIKQAARLLPPQAPLLVHNVDIFHHIDLRACYRQQQHNDQATLITTQRHTSRFLLADGHGYLRAWTNTLTGEVRPADTDTHGLTPHAFTGIHIITPALIQRMEEWPEKFSIIDFYLRNCTQAHIKLLRLDDPSLIDVGKIATLQQAEERARRQTHC